MTITLPMPVRTALDKLTAAGYEAYIVGGCVRDSLLGRTPNDYDITTSALPEQTAAVFADERTLPTGLKHGTLTVLIDGMPIEITTYRVDGGYTDHRHPDRVTFTSLLTEDLRRRDFTINAMAYHPDVGLVDPFSGVADLSRGRIVCVGDPEHRFTEDALRLMRALRFSAELGFPIEKVTAQALRRLAPLLRRVSPERIAAELTRLLCAPHCRKLLLDYPDVISIILPELSATVGLRQDNPYHYLTVYEHTVETVAAAPAQPILRLTMLLHDCGKPQCYTRDENGVDHFRGHAPIGAAMAERALTRLRFDRKTIQTVKLLVQHHDDDLPKDEAGFRRLLGRYGGETAHLLLEVKRADVLGQHPDKRDRLDALDAAQATLDRLIEQSACCTLRELTVDGQDLIALGFAPGKALGRALDTLLAEVIDGRVENERAPLLERAAQLLD